MLLRGARDRLNADLRREYGVCLTDMYEGRVSVLDVADFAHYLSRGGAVSKWIGGWGAVTAEEERLERLEYLLRAQIVQASGKRKSPPEPKPPQSIRETEIADKKAADLRAKKAAAMERMSLIFSR